MSHTAWALDENGDFPLVEDEYGNKDVAVVTGDRYVAQSARIRLTTPRGSYPLAPEFGFPRSQVQTIFNRPFVDGSIRRTLDEDPDIGDVEVLDVDLGGRKRNVDVALRIFLADGSEITLEGAVM